MAGSRLPPPQRGEHTRSQAAADAYGPPVGETEDALLTTQPAHVPLAENGGRECVPVPGPMLVTPLSRCLSSSEHASFPLRSHHRST